MKARRVLVLGVISLCGLMLGFARPAQPPPDLVITNARLIDGTGRVYDRVDITIAGGRIRSITPVDRPVALASNAQLPLKERVQPLAPRSVTGDGVIQIDANGKPVIPGLIDAHVHLLDFGIIEDEDTLDQYIATTLPARLKEFLSYGVTTLKSTADPEDAILQIRDRLSHGQLLGPRLFVVGSSMIASGDPLVVTLYTNNPWFHARTTSELTTEEEVRGTVQRLARKRVDALKLVYQANMYQEFLYLDDDDRDPPYGSLPARWRSRALLKAMIDEGHRHHLRVTAHTADEEDALFLVEAGIDGLEHGVTHTRLRDERLSTRLRDRGVSYVPTLSVYAEAIPEYYENARANLQRLAQSGVRIVLGTDTFGDMPAGLSTIQEAELMVQAGLTPAQVIQAATRNAAEHLGMLETLGTVEPGKLADLLILDQDPLKDITALRTVEVVVKDGQVVVNKRVQP